MSSPISEQYSQLSSLESTSEYPLVQSPKQSSQLRPQVKITTRQTSSQSKTLLTVNDVPQMLLFHNQTHNSQRFQACPGLLHDLALTLYSQAPKPCGHTKLILKTHFKNHLLLVMANLLTVNKCEKRDLPSSILTCEWCSRSPISK